MYCVQLPITGTSAASSKLLDFMVKLCQSFHTIGSYGKCTNKKSPNLRILGCREFSSTLTTFSSETLILARNSTSAQQHIGTHISNVCILMFQEISSVKSNAYILLKYIFLYHKVTGLKVL